MESATIHAPRYGGRIIRGINGGTVAAGGGWSREHPRRLDFATNPSVWIKPA